jgi:hypothetical protein
MQVFPYSHLISLVEQQCESPITMNQRNIVKQTSVQWLIFFSLHFL